MTPRPQLDRFEPGEPCPDDRRQVLIVANPRSGARDGQSEVRELAARLCSRDIQAEIITDLDEASAAVEEAFAEGRLRAVIVAGGDGTVLQVVNRTLPEIPIAIFPLGTENLLGFYLGFRRDVAAMVRTIEGGKTGRLDAGLANGRLFTVVTGCGFDAEVVARVDAARTGNITQWSYAKPILSTIRDYAFPELRVSYFTAGEGGPPTEQTLTGRWVFISNIPIYGGGLRLSPAAVATDGLLDICVMEKGHFWNGLRYLACERLGLLDRLGDVKRARATRLRIESDRPVRYQLDGDPGGFLPLDVEVLPRRLTVVIPP